MLPLVRALRTPGGWQEQLDDLRVARNDLARPRALKSIFHCLIIADIEKSVTTCVREPGGDAPAISTKGPSCDH